MPKTRSPSVYLDQRPANVCCRGLRTNYHRLRRGQNLHHSHTSPPHRRAGPCSGLTKSQLDLASSQPWFPNLGLVQSAHLAQKGERRASHLQGRQAGRKPDSRSCPKLLSVFSGSTLSLACIRVTHQTFVGLVQCNDTSLTPPCKESGFGIGESWEMGGEKGTSGQPRGLPVSQEFLGPSPGGHCQDDKGQLYGNSLRWDTAW